jgi:SAM-dependent methyltransferase
MTDETGASGEGDDAGTGEDAHDGGEAEEEARDAESGLDGAAQRTAVRERYAGIAADTSSCCGGDDGGCGDGPTAGIDADRARELGYAEDDLAAVEPGANLGLGCGNPTAIASLEQGDTVLDLGSGAGFDCFLAAREVGDAGRVIGVDMTPEMVERARENAASNDAGNVEFRLGEIEHLPVADATVDVAISNCVINLSPDKAQVFREAARVLRPGGRLAVSDVVRTTELPADLAVDPSSVTGCVGGAATVADLEAMLADAGFVDVSVEPKADSDEFVREWDPDRDLSDYVLAARIEATKPTAETRPETPASN